MNENTHADHLHGKTHENGEHPDHAVSSLEQVIVDILSKAGKPYLTVSQIKNHLSVGLLRELGLSRQKSPNAKVLGALNIRIGGRLRAYKGPRALYIGTNRSNEDIILDKIKQYPGVSPKALAARLPMLKRECLDSLNSLMGSGRIRCTVNHDYRPALWPVESETSNQNFQNPQALFKEAYDRVGKGRGFVRIHRIREALSWPAKVFDQTLGELMAAYVIELHGGDPSVLSEEEIRRSFVDENGTLYITMSWWGNDHEK